MRSEATSWEYDNYTLLLALRTFLTHLLLRSSARFARSLAAPRYSSSQYKNAEIRLCALKQYDDAKNVRRMLKSIDAKEEEVFNKGEAIPITLAKSMKNSSCSF